MNKKIIITILVSLSVIFGGVFYSRSEQKVSGIFNPTGGKTYRLQSSVSSSATTLTLSSFKEPVSNIPYTMSYLNSTIEYATIEPNNNSTKEFVSFTGITQNSDGTATISGLTRGLGFSYPYTASTTLQQPHPGQSIFILSNPPQLTNQYANKNNDETIVGAWSVPTPAPADVNQVANVAYVNGVSFGGVATSTETSGGIVELATQQEMASSTNATATKPLVMQSKYATSSPYTTGMWSPVTDKDGKLNQTFWRLTDNFTFLGRFTTSGTTTIPASSVTNNALNLNGQNYAIQSTRGAASTTLMEDGSGNLTWVNPDFSIIASTTLTSAVSTTTLSFAGRNDLRIIIDIPVMTGTTVLDIIFNSDTAANYGWHLSNNLAAFEGGNTQKAIVLSPSAGLTNVGYYHNLNVTNQGGRTKRILWNGQAYIDTASNQNFLLGDANYTSTSKLTSISVGSQGVQLPANTRIIVYGSPN